MIRALIEVKSLKKQCNASETITARRVSGHLCFNDRLLQKKYDNFVSSLRKDIQLAVRDGKKLYTVEVNCRIFFENKEDDLKVISNLVEEAWGDLPIMVIIDS